MVLGFGRKKDKDKADEESGEESGSDKSSEDGDDKDDVEGEDGDEDEEEQINDEGEDNGEEEWNEQEDNENGDRENYDENEDVDETYDEEEKPENASELNDKGESDAHDSDEEGEENGTNKTEETKDKGGKSEEGGVDNDTSTSSKASKSESMSPSKPPPPPSHEGVSGPSLISCFNKKVVFEREEELRAMSARLLDKNGNKISCDLVLLWPCDVLSVKRKVAAQASLVDTNFPLILAGRGRLKDGDLFPEVPRTHFYFDTISVCVFSVCFDFHASHLLTLSVFGLIGRAACSTTSRRKDTLRSRKVYKG